MAVDYYEPNKTSHRVTGKIFILAANGMESPKLLLLSASDKFPRGLVNSSDMVGRNLMDHPSNSLAFEADEDLWLGRGHQSPSPINTLRDGAFRSEHATFRLDFTNISQARAAAEALIAEGVYGPELDKQLRHRAARQVSVKSVTEVPPNPKNRVVLSDQRDALGIPKPKVFYSFDDYLQRVMQVAATHFLRIAAAMGGVNIKPSKPGVYDNNQHITGTMSMGDDPTNSVVDRFGRAHDHENLFIVGTGVMPTPPPRSAAATASISKPRNRSSSRAPIAATAWPCLASSRSTAARPQNSSAITRRASPIAALCPDGTSIF